MDDSNLETALNDRRETLLLREDPNFRWRGQGITRLEGFSDAVFAFAITLLIVTLDVPRTFDGLLSVLQGFPAFAVSFVLLFYLWYQHHLFFRRYGLTTLRVICLNALLLFLVLFFVYPVKFLAALLINGLLLNRFLGLEVPIGIDQFEAASYPLLYTFYAVGFSLLFLIFTLFYSEAHKYADHFELNAEERYLTLLNYGSFLVLSIVPLIGLVIVWIVPGAWGGHLSGWIFLIIWPLIALLERRLQRRFPDHQSDSPE